MLRDWYRIYCQCDSTGRRQTMMTDELVQLKADGGVIVTKRFLSHAALDKGNQWA